MKRISKREQVAKELEALGYRGRLSPQRVVGWAQKNRNSALHGCFQWDDSKAAHQHRLWQARQLIVSVTVEYPDGKARQVYVSPLTSRGPKGGYRSLVSVLSSEALREEFLRQALEELERVCAKYEDLSELAGVRAAVKLVRVNGAIRARKAG